MQYCLDALELFSLENKIDLPCLLLDANCDPSSTSSSILSTLLGPSNDTTNAWQSKWRLFLKQLQSSTLTLKGSLPKNDFPQVAKPELSPKTAKKESLLPPRSQIIKESDKRIEPPTLPLPLPLPRKTTGSYKPSLPWALRPPKVSTEEDTTALKIESEDESIQDIDHIEDLTDMDIYHLGLQIKHLPLHKLLENATKVVSTDAWDFARREIQVLQMIGQFEAYRESILTESAWDNNQISCNIDAQSMNHGVSMGTALHVRRGNNYTNTENPLGSDISTHDQLLEEMQWMSRDFMEERTWKLNTAKKIVDEISKYSQILSKESLDESHGPFAFKPSKLKESIIKGAKKDEKLGPYPICVSLQNDEDLGYFTKDKSPKETAVANEPTDSKHKPYTRIYRQKYLKHIQHMQEQLLFSGKRPFQEELSGESVSAFVDPNIKQFHNSTIQSPVMNSPNSGSIADSLQAPWNALEEEIIQVLVRLLSGLESRDLENVNDSGKVPVLNSDQDEKLPWSFIASYINAHCHKGSLIRSAAAVEAHFLHCQRSSRQRRTSGEGESSNTTQQLFGLGSSNSSSKASSASSGSIVPFPRLLTAEDKRAWRVRQFEQLMLCFLTMKKRPRFKPALHQIAAANVAQILAKASSGITSGVSSAGGPNDLGISGNSSGPASVIGQPLPEVDNPMISPSSPSTTSGITGVGSVYPPPPPAAIALLSNRKLNAAIHQSHEGAIKKGAYISGLTHKAYYSPSELANYKKARLQQLPSQPNISLPSGQGHPEAPQASAVSASSTGQPVGFTTQQQPRPGLALNAPTPGLQHQQPGPSGALVSSVPTASAAANATNAPLPAMPTAATGIPAATPLSMPPPPHLRNMAGFSVSSVSPSLSVTSTTTASISGRASPSLNVGTGIPVGQGGFAPNPSMAFHPMMHPQHVQQQHLQLRQGMPMVGSSSNFTGPIRTTQQPGMMMLSQQQQQQQATGVPHHSHVNPSGPASKEYNEQQPQQLVNILATHSPATSVHRSSGYVPSNTDLVTTHSQPHAQQSSFTPLYYNSNPQMHLMQQQMQYLQQHNMNYMSTSLSTNPNPTLQSGGTNRSFSSVPAGGTNPLGLSLATGSSGSVSNTTTNPLPPPSSANNPQQN